LIENLDSGMLWVQKFLTQNLFYTSEKEKTAKKISIFNYLFFVE